MVSHDFLLGVFVGLCGGLVIGAVLGIAQFRKGIEDGLKLHKVLDVWKEMQ